MRQRRLTDILISVCTVVGFLFCTGSVQMWAKKRENQRMWRHSVSVAMFTIVVIRVIWTIFFFVFLDMCGSLSTVNRKNLDTLESWESYEHQCSDEYSVFDVQQRTKDQLSVTSNIEQAETFLWAVTILVIVEVIPVLCWFAVNCLRDVREARAKDRRRQYEMAAGV